MAVFKFPYEYVPDSTRGQPIFNGELYFGIKDLDPTIPANQIPISVQQEDGSVVVVAQPIQTSPGGVPLYNGSPVQIIVSADSFSFAVLDHLGAQVFYQANVTAFVTAEDIATTFVTVEDIATGNTAAPIKTPTVATMKTLTGLADGALIHTLGHFSVGDNGAISARYDIGSLATPGPTVFQPDSGPGRFFMINSNKGDFRRYGIKSDNTDQAAAIQAVLSDSNIQWLDLGGQTIRVDSALTCTRSLVIENGALDFSNNTAALSALSVNGALGASTSVTASITKGATSFTVSSNALFSAGKRVLILSSDAWASSVTKGEWVTVSSVVGTTINTQEPIQDSYATTILAYVPTMLVAPRFYGLRMIGSNRQVDTGQSALKLAYMEDLEVDDVHCFGWDDRGVELQRAFGFSIRGVSGESMKHSGLAYAVVTGNCVQHGTISGTRGKDVRHVVAVGGETGVDRDITVTDTIGTDMRESTTDCHPGSEGISFQGFQHRSDGVTEGDGALMQGLNCTMSDGVIHSTKRHGVVLQPLVTAYRCKMTVTNVQVIGANNNSSSTGFISTSEVAQDVEGFHLSNCAADQCNRGYMVEATSSGQNINGYSLTGCNSHRTSGDIANYILARSGKVIRDISISGGKYEMTATTAGKYCIYLNAAAANGVTDTTISGVTTAAGEYGIRGSNATKNVIVGNRIRAWGVAATTGITHDGTNEIIANNVTVA